MHDHSAPLACSLQHHAHECLRKAQPQESISAHMHRMGFFWRHRTSRVQTVTKGKARVGHSQHGARASTVVPNQRYIKSMKRALPVRNAHGTSTAACIWSRDVKRHMTTPFSHSSVFLESASNLSLPVAKLSALCNERVPVLALPYFNHALVSLNAKPLHQRSHVS